MKPIRPLDDDIRAVDVDDDIRAVDVDEPAPAYEPLSISSNPFELDLKSKEEQKTQLKLTEYMRQRKKLEYESDPANWSLEKTEQHFKQNPPKTIDEEAEKTRLIQTKQTKQEQLADSLEIDSIKQQTIPGWQRAARSVAAGAVSTVEATGGGLQWLGLQGLGKNVERWGKVARQYYEVPDPKFFDQVMSGFGSLGTFLIPGVGVSKGVQALSFAPKLAAWLGISASSALESMVEGGSSYLRAKQKGFDEKGARSAATFDFWMNLPTVVFTNKLGIFGDKGKDAFKILAAAGMEGTQEFTQALYSNIAVSDPIMQQALASFGVGAITGGGVKAAGAVVENAPAIAKDIAARAKEVRPIGEVLSSEKGEALLPGSPEEQKFNQKFTIELTKANEERAGVGAIVTDEEKKAQAWALENPQKLRENYIQESIKDVGADNVLSSDIGKYAVNDPASGLKMTAARSADYHEIGSAVKKAREEELLAIPGKEHLPVGATAGGSGSGKTTFLRQTGGNIQTDFLAVHDINFDNFPSAKKSIDAALAAGHEFKTFGVYRDPIVAFEHGVIPRVRSKDRIVPIKNHIKTHRDWIAAVKQAQAYYADNPKVKFYFATNLGETAHFDSIKSLDEVPQFDYTGIEDKLYGKLVEAYQNGKLTKSEFDTFLVGSPKLQERAAGESLRRDVRASESENQRKVGQGPSAGLTPQQNLQESLSTINQALLNNLRIPASKDDGLNKRQKEFFVSKLMEARQAILKAEPNLKDVYVDKIPVLSKAEETALEKPAQSKVFQSHKERFIELGLVEQNGELTKLGEIVHILNISPSTVGTNASFNIKIPGDGEFKILNNLSAINEMLKRLGVKTLETPAPGAPKEAVKEKEAPKQAPQRFVVNNQVETSSGRMIPAPPGVRTDTGRKASKDMKALDQWLIDQYQAEAVARRDDYAQTIFQGRTAGKLTQSDKDMVNDYLFGETDPKFYKQETSQQKEQVKQAVSGQPKTIKQVAEETKILEPNVRRILGVGAKDGTFERVEKGVYVLRKDGRDLAFIHAGDSVEVLPKLAAKGFKADMVFLDIPYKTPAVIGGNRGIKYAYITPDQFQTVVKSVKKIAREENSPVIYMYSQAKSGQKAMKQYTDVLINQGFKPVARGEYTKLQKDGVTRVRNMRGDIIEPEGIIVFSQSGKVDFKANPDLNFKLIRPKGYQTEKPAEMLNKMIKMTTEEGDVVLDPFAGSGVTVAEAVREGRTGVGVEISEKAIKEHIEPKLAEVIGPDSMRRALSTEELQEKMAEEIEASAKKIMRPGETLEDNVARTKDWISDTLTNDETSNAVELVDYFMKEGGFSEDVALFIVQHRNKVRSLPFGVKKEYIEPEPATKIGDILPGVLPKPGEPAAAIPERQLPEGEEDLPGKRRKFIKTVKESERTAPELAEIIESRYQPLSMQAALDEAKAIIEGDYNRAVELAEGPEKATRLSNAVSQLLIVKAQQEKRWEDAKRLVERTAEKNTELGQTIQILAAYNRLTPEGVLQYATRVVRDARKNLSQPERIDFFNKKAADLSEDEQQKLADKLGIPFLGPKGGQGLYELAQKIREGNFDDVIQEELAKSLKPTRALVNYILKKETNERKGQIAEAILMKRIAALVPPGLGRRVSLWQTMAQLLNPKTIVRNLFGNTGFFGVENLKDVVGTSIDVATALWTGERTQYMPGLAAQWHGLAKGAKEGTLETLLGVNLRNLNQAKFDVPQTVIYNRGFLAALEKSLRLVLGVPDRAFWQAAYNQSLRNSMLTAKATEPTEEMIEKAIASGWRRTFQDDNIISKQMVRLKKWMNNWTAEAFPRLKGEWGAGDLVIKYPGTPSSILHRGIEYSPYSFWKALWTFQGAMRRKQFGGEKQAEFVEAAARGITGTSLIVAGMVLAAMGIISGRRAKDKDVAALRESSGLREYQVNIDALSRFTLSGFDPEAAKIQEGDTHLTYDWALPMSISMALGANIVLDPKGGWIDKTMNIGESLLSAAETIEQQPMLQGLRLLTGKSSLGEGVAEIGQSLPASFIPTLLNQVRQVTDNTSRNTKDLNYLKEMYNKVAMRVPGLAGTLPPKITSLGDVKEMYQGGSNNPFNVFLNPAFVTKYQPTPVAKMVLDIWENSGQTVQFPRVVSAGKIKIAGFPEPVELTPAQYVEYQKYIGHKTDVLFSILATKPKTEVVYKQTKVPFNRLTDEAKASVLSNLLTDIGQAGRIAILGSRPKQVQQDVLSILKSIGRDIKEIRKNDPQPDEDIRSEDVEEEDIRAVDVNE